ncbi:hypothetical protein B0H12DRAFT_1105967, partial [Mycena haematopus]
MSILLLSRDQKLSRRAVEAFKRPSVPCLYLPVVTLRVHDSTQITVGPWSTRNLERCQRPKQRPIRNFSQLDITCSHRGSIGMLQVLATPSPRSQGPSDVSTLDLVSAIFAYSLRLRIQISFLLRLVDSARLNQLLMFVMSKRRLCPSAAPGTI